jgi:hypothetical protein
MLSTGRFSGFLFTAVLLVCPLSGNRASAQSQNASAPNGAASRGANLAAIPSRELRRPSDAWVPPDIDSVAPSLIAPASCSLPDVVAGAAKRVQELVNNLDRFTATELLAHQSVSGSGKLGKVETRKFDYLVSLGPGQGGYLTVQEYRSRSSNPVQFPDRIATEGTPILVLVFHPSYARDFDMKCEGLSSWHGQPAWQVRFEQRRDRPNRLNNVVVKDKMYSVRLRGRAWILADSYQVARMETDLADAIPAIKLRVEHLSVEYRPVEFPGRQTELWLPAIAELFLDLSGRRFYRRHSFTNFTLFSVDVDQQFASAVPPR